MARANGEATEYECTRELIEALTAMAKEISHDLACIRNELERTADALDVLAGRTYGIAGDRD